MSVTIYILFAVLLISFLLYWILPWPSAFKGMEGNAQTKDTKDLFKAVRKVEIKTKGLTNHIFAGEYHSAFKGRGMSFSEVREYQYGDDIRNIDWNVTARFNQPYVKIYEEERELIVMLLVDVSESAFFGTKGQMKNELVTELCAVLAFSAINNNDKVGVIFFSDKIEKFIPPKKGKSHILRIIRELINFKPVQAPTNIAEALKYFSNVMKKRTIAFLLSDYMDQDYSQSLNLVSRKHDLIGLHIYDAWEEEVPSVGMIRVRDSETGERKWLNTSSKSVREAQAENFRENLESCRSAFRKSGSDLISIRTDRPYVKELMNFFKKRGT